MRKLLLTALLLGAFLPAPALASFVPVPRECRFYGTFGSWVNVCSKPTPKPTTKPLRCKKVGRFGIVYVPCVPTKSKGNGAIDGNGIENRVNNGLYTDEVWNKLK